MRKFTYRVLFFIGLSMGVLVFPVWLVRLFYALKYEENHLGSVMLDAAQFTVGQIFLSILITIIALQLKPSKTQSPNDKQKH
ncbi:hypothetical protein [Vibrio parahaemolyticus]|uniref:hypothetical protein n=1 Tax=Vibrio parahaemolyticus TaxID=670 RepID=UPI000C9B92FC|nr:hypothetical protein [Vibrio parahaemolyticus]PMS91916.1 hypothetical protein C1T06_22740 [Vibrio parahaemolyticus]